MKIIKRIIAVLITVILLIILSFNLFNFISIRILGNELPTINGYALLEVISGSMEPKISKGDIVVIDTKVKKYKVNDIITFKDVNGSFVTHRIVEINDSELITKGDANNTIDEAIDKDMIIGRYVYQINGIGALIKSLRSPFILGMILVIGILLCVLVSTDSKGNVILTDEEKEYLEFLESKKKKDKTDTKKKEVIEKKTTKTSKKTEEKKIDNKQKESVTPKKAVKKKETPTVKKSDSNKKETTSKKTSKNKIEK